MIIAVISDIHGNLEALNAVLGDVESQNVRDIICLGDMIGYGPDPDKVVKSIMERNISTILGNHENVVVYPSSLRWFNPSAKEAVKTTLSLLSEESKVFITGLPKYIVKDGRRYVHGFPPGSVRKYLFQATHEELTAYFKRSNESICFVGHTHFLEIITFNGGDNKRKDLRKKPVSLDPDEKYIVNAGSVGQPRDGDMNAKYILLDTVANEMMVRFVSYDNEKTASKIIKAGMPEVYARRLL